MKKILLSMGALLVLLVVLAILLPFIIDLNKYQDRYRPLIEDALNRKVSLTDMRLTILPRLGVRIAGFTVMDDPTFSAGAFASLTALDVGVKLLPLLTGRVEVEEITLQDPVITVIKNRQGVLNVSTFGATRPPKPEIREPQLPPPPAEEGPLRALALLAVDEVSLTGGRLAYEDHSSKTPTEYRIHDLRVHVHSVRLGETPRLHMAATVQPYNLPVTIDGEFGPLAETLDLKVIDIAIALGKTILAMKGSVVGGHVQLVLTSPTINTADLPITLPLTKPVQVRDLRIATEGRYPPEEGIPIERAVDVKSLNLAVVLGASVVALEGSAVDGEAKIKASSPSINSADLPIDLPLTKPVLVKDLLLQAKAKYPLREGIPPQEVADVTALDFQVVLGNSSLVVKGSAIDGDVKLTASSPAINTADLPVTLPLRKPIEAKNVRMAAGMKGSEARLQSLALDLFNGRLFAQGGLTIGTTSPPFDGNVILEKVQLGPILDAVTDTVSASGTVGLQAVVRGRGFTIPELTRSLAGTSHFAVKDGKLEGVNLVQDLLDTLKAAGVRRENVKATIFSTVEGDLTIKGGLVNVDRLLVDSHDFQATAKGTVGFDQTLNLRANVNLSESLSKQIAGTSPVAKLALTKGRMTVPLIVAGTAQSPSYAIDGKAIGAKVTEQVKEVVGELLKGKDGKGLDIEKGAETLKKFFGQ